MIWSTPIEVGERKDCRTSTAVQSVILLIDVADGGCLDVSGWGSLPAPTRTHTPIRSRAEAGDSGSFAASYQAKLDQLARFGFTGRAALLACSEATPEHVPEATSPALMRASASGPFPGVLWR